VGTFRLPPLQGAVLLKALRAAASDLDHPHDGQEPGVSAETPADAPAPPGFSAQRPGHPADPARCHVEDGLALSVTTAQMIACSAAWSWMLHDSAGKLLDLGRRRRRRVDLHHIQYWSHGGRTPLGNLTSLCEYHHMLVHDRGYLIAAARDGTFTFHRPDGTAIPASPSPPPPDGTIGDCHDADITPDTIIPPWYGERLDLDHAIYVCFANAANRAALRDSTDQHASSSARANTCGAVMHTP
jgi:hypothetical protein